MTFHVVSITNFERKVDGFGMSKSIKSNTHRLSRLGHFKLFLSFNAFSKVISKVEWIKKKSADFRFDGPKSGLVLSWKWYLIYLAFETKVIDKSSLIFPKDQCYLIRFYFGSSSKFLGPIDFSHFSQKRILIFYVNFLLATIYW